jgi:CO/xanthine dehydrogenase Mo-binding subunit
LGGGFGGKGDATIQPLAALAAHLLKRPVKITLSREESLNMSTIKHPYHLQYEIGLNREGILRYVDAEILSDGGPYANLSPRVIDQSCIFAVGPYRIAAGRVRGRCVRTNNVLSSAMRGFGINQVSYAMEVLLDQASHKLRIDPFVLRERNAFASGDKTFSGEILYDSVGTLATLRACQERLRRVEEPYRKVYPKGTKSLGIGMATCFKNVGAGKGRVDNAGATITRTRKGTFLLEVSGVDMGQGFRTAMVQLASETLSVPMSAISVVNGDTDRTAIHGSAVGERQTLVSGMAVVKACQLLQEKICIADAQEVVSVHYDHQAPRTFSLGDDEGRASVPPEQYKNYPAYAYATQAVVLEVDRQTGQVNVLEVVAAHDTGRVLNQTVLEGQIEGCCSMGIGYALSEQFRVARGQAQTKYYGQLGVPTIKQTPNYHILLIEDPEPSGPYGAKGISEVGTVLMTAAIINAIADAVGVYITSLPATPQAILTALQEAENITL